MKTKKPIKKRKPITVWLVCYQNPLGEFRPSFDIGTTFFRRKYAVQAIKRSTHNDGGYKAVKFVGQP